MKSTFVMVLLLGVVSTVVLAQNYPNKFDQVNIETVLQNDRVLTNYIKCLLDKGACTREGRDLKSKYLFHTHSINWIFNYYFGMAFIQTSSFVPSILTWSLTRNFIKPNTIDACLVFLYNLFTHAWLRLYVLSHHSSSLTYSTPFLY